MTSLIEPGGMFLLNDNSNVVGLVNGWVLDWVIMLSLNLLENICVRLSS